MKSFLIAFLIFISSTNICLAEWFCFSVISVEPNDELMVGYVFNRIKNKFGVDDCNNSNSFNFINIVIDYENKVHTASVFYSNRNMLKSEIENIQIPSVKSDCNIENDCIDKFLDRIFIKINAVKEVYTEK